MNGAGSDDVLGGHLQLRRVQDEGTSLRTTQAADDEAGEDVRSKSRFGRFDTIRATTAASEVGRTVLAKRSSGEFADTDGHESRDDHR